MIDIKTYKINDDIDEIIVETFDDGKPWLSVRPVNINDKNLKVMFPKKIRGDYPVGTKFNVRVKLSQKYFLSGENKGKPKGNPYFYSYEDTIKIIK